MEVEGGEELVRRQRSDAAHETRLAVCCLVLVDDALGGSHVNALDGQAQCLDGVVIVALCSNECGLGPGLHLGLDGLVAQTCALVLLVALDLALDVRHLKPQKSTLLTPAVPVRGELLA